MTDIVVNRYGSIGIDEALKFDDDVFDIYYKDEPTYSGNDQVEFVIKFQFLKKYVLLKKAFKVKIQVTDLERKNSASRLRKDLVGELLEDRFNAVKHFQMFSSIKTYDEVKPQPYKIILSGDVDLTKFINNVDINGKFSKLAVSFVDNTLAVENSIPGNWSETESVVNTDFSSLSDFSARMLRLGKDPSLAYDHLIDDSDFLKTLNGTFSEKNKNKHLLDFDLTFFKSIIPDNYADPLKELMVPVYQKIETDFIEASWSTNILLSKLSLGQMFVYLDLIDEKNKVISTIKKKFSINSFLNAFKIPKKTPGMKVQKINRMGMDLLKIKFMNSNSNILLENISESLLSRYSNVSTTLETSDLMNNQLEVYPSPNLRIIKSSFINQGIAGISSDRFVLKKGRNNNNVSGFVVAYQSDNNNVQIIIKDHDKNSASLATIYRKNLTYKSDGVKEIATVQFINGRVDFLDNNLIDDHVYEYYARVTHNNQSSTFTRSDIIQFRRFNSKEQFFVAKNIKNDIEGVRFDIDVINDKKAANTILSIIRENDVEFYFNNLIKDSEITKFQDLIHFQVFRVNLENGVRVNLGTFSNSETFVDIEKSNRKGVSPYNNVEDCIYEVHPFLIEFNDLTSQQKVVFSLENNNYQNFSKFYSYYNRKKSLSITKDSLQKKKCLTPLTGLNVISQPLILKFYGNNDSSKKSLSNLKAELIKKTSTTSEVFLSWDSTSKEIDYFLILRTYNGFSKPVGKSNNGTKIGSFIDKTSLKGEIFYSVCAVNFDGEVNFKEKVRVFI